MSSTSSKPRGKKAAVASTLNAECLALGRRIKELRGERGITQEELADRSDLFRTYLSRIERGTANPTLSILHALAGALGVEVGELLASHGNAIPARVKAGSARVSRGRVGR
ncbi:MAG TPA: helix-turn-helix transcriptional regulator [Ramlibacter sp.]|uniref:helix-turn-helix domain-containing protein n=1 Tax=Ramlibacter sp. TaxID=1917967 RepID=UPI002BDCBD92|nr:helix-turn-helix transcriptional regulator [Ramlibacter sp.]HVZ45612.1 helix-turn-helix transcriptional regulator [Ramlibacter sp.]